MSAAPFSGATFFLIRETGVISATKSGAGVASGIYLPAGALCRVGALDGALAESIGFSAQGTLLMSLSPDHQWEPGTVVYFEPPLAMPNPDMLLGRVVDGLGAPMDGGGPIATLARGPARPARTPANPMERRRLGRALDVGVRAINGLLPVAHGQRLGIFAGSGVGKSSLLSMMARHTHADRVVLALIGERSREVREFIEDNLGPAGLAKSVVVAVSAGHTPLMKMRAAHLACDLADQFKERGESCLFIMDSLTRYAMACREVGLACGETPAGKGYPPSVFSRVNSLVERAGPGNESLDEGDITAFYTVLSEGDDLQDPVADNARAILDGHIVLSRKIADGGIYPPIDIPASVSRAASAIASREQQELMRRYRQLLSAYLQNEDLIKAGAYQAGQDPTLDQALARIGPIQEYCRQEMEQPCDIPDALSALRAILD